MPGTPPSPICEEPQATIRVTPPRRAPVPVGESSAIDVEIAKLQENLVVATNHCPAKPALDAAHGPEQLIPCNNKEHTTLCFVPVNKVERTTGLDSYKAVRDRSGKDTRFRPVLCPFFDDGPKKCEFGDKCRFIHAKSAGFFKFKPHHNPFSDKKVVNRGSNNSTNPHHHHHQPGPPHANVNNTNPLDDPAITDVYGRLSLFAEDMRDVEYPVKTTDNKKDQHIAIKDMFITLGALLWLRGVLSGSANDGPAAGCKTHPPNSLSHCHAFQSKHATCQHGALCTKVHTAVPQLSPPTTPENRPRPPHSSSSQQQSPRGDSRATIPSPTTPGLVPFAHAPLYVPYPQAVHHFHHQTMYATHQPQQQQPQFASPMPALFLQPPHNASQQLPGAFSPQHAAPTYWTTAPPGMVLQQPQQGYWHPGPSYYVAGPNN